MTRDLATVLAEEARAIVGAVPDSAAFLADWPLAVTRRPAIPAHLPVLAALPHLAGLASPQTRLLVEHVIDAAGALAWRQTYGPEDFGPAFLQCYGWSELVGLRGPIPSERVACGLLLLGASIDYPAHAHEAEELYVPLAGTALWRRGAEPWTARRPGEPIHHPAWMPHAMRTADQPMLALYLWRGGDLAAKSRIASFDD